MAEGFLVNYLPQAPSLVSTIGVHVASPSLSRLLNGLYMVSNRRPRSPQGISAALVSSSGPLYNTSRALATALRPSNPLNVLPSSNNVPTASVGNSGSLKSNAIATNYHPDLSGGISVASISTPTSSDSNSVGPASSPSSSDSTSNSSLSNSAVTVSASDPGLSKPISSSGLLNGTSGAPSSESGSTNSNLTDAVNTSSSSSIWPTPYVGTFPGAGSQRQPSASVHSASPGSSKSVEFAPVTTSAPSVGGQGSSLPSTNGTGSVTVTSTDTVQPSNASTEGSTNSAWTENLWLTTQKDGHTTIVPVIVGCPGCGGRGGGLILWNFPSIPRVSFQFPKFPELGSISLDCIPVPLISDCSSPPRSEFSFRTFVLRTLISHRR